jgi:hypothetical protein
VASFRGKDAVSGTLEAKLAKLIRMLGTEHEGEALVAWRKLGNLLAANSASFTELGDAVEKLANGGLEEGAMKRVFDAGYQKGLLEAERRHTEDEAVFGKRPDGSYDWLAMALYCQRNPNRLKNDWERGFVNDMAARLSAGRDPTAGQVPYLLAAFRRLGGRIS